MTKNNRRMACFGLAYSVFCGGELPLVNTKKQAIELPSKGIKGLSNQELNANSSTKNKRKRCKK